MGAVTTQKQQWRRLARRGKLLFSLRPYLGLLEKLYLRKNQCHSPAPQIFILGLPRSGTTLIYQYIVHRLKVAYFTHGVGHYYLSPCLITSWQHRKYGEYKSDFHSQYGKVTGPVSPREAGAFWGRFFDVDAYTRFEDVRHQKIVLLQSSIFCVQKIFGNKPFVNKNVKHMLRLDALSKIFPESCFLVVERDLKDVALSVLRGRYKNLEDPSEWWSVKPENYATLKDLPVAEQVANQLVALKKRMSDDLANVPSNRVIHIDYESFCHNPELLISQLKEFFPKLEDKNPPENSFQMSKNLPQSTEEIELVELVSKYAHVPS